MPRKPLYNERQYDRLISRQHSLQALAATAAEKHIARGSLSSGPWNKCARCGIASLIITGEVYPVALKYGSTSTSIFHAM